MRGRSRRGGGRGAAAPRTTFRAEWNTAIMMSNQQLTQRASIAADHAAHRVEELVVRFGRADLVEQELHRLEVVHRVEEFAQHPDLLQDFGLDQQFLAAGAGAVDVDRREDPLLVHAPVEMDLHVAGALELFVDHVVHARAGIDQRGGEDRERTAFLDVARRAEEALGPLQRVRIDTAGQHLAGGRHDGVVGAPETGDRVEQDDDVASCARPGAWPSRSPSRRPARGGWPARRRSRRRLRP